MIFLIISLIILQSITILANKDQLISLSSNLNGLSHIKISTKPPVKQKDEYKVGKVSILLKKEDILSIPTDAVVNAANEGCLGGGGIDGFITSKGGTGLALARKNLPQESPGIRCPETEARITISGDIKNTKSKAKYVLHAVGPSCSGTKMTQTEKIKLANTYTNTLERVNAFNSNPKNSIYKEFKNIDTKKINSGNYQIKSVTFPTISTGIFGCTTDQSAEPVVKAVIDFLKNNQNTQIKKVILTFYPLGAKADNDYNNYKKALNKFIK